MAALSVNINKLATLRNSRGKNNPDLLQWVREIEAVKAPGGATVLGITVHPRPDERHVRFADVRTLASRVRGEFNIEGFPDENWLKLVREVNPHQATLVPDPPHALTSDAGFYVTTQAPLIEAALASVRLPGQQRPTRVSVFIDPKNWSRQDAQILSELGVERIELYTEAYANAKPGADRIKQLKIYKEAAVIAKEFGLGVNAGHDMSLENLPDFVTGIPEVSEVSIGHALICDALRWGMEATVLKYLNILNSLSPR